jgi:ribosomal protein S18 acetylase RimI-like enzyme
VIIRPYLPADRDDVRRIAADTAFFGAPVERFLDDRRLFADEMCAYYTDFEPEHLWVAAADTAEAAPAGAVAGYLFGCVDTARQLRIWTRRILPHLMLRAITGRYRVGRKTWRYALAALGAARRGEFPRVDLGAYPAHLHINLEARFRGAGGGRRLMEAYLAQLAGLGVRGVHLRTTSENAAAVAMYTRLGFTLLDARPTQMWTAYVGHAVENRVYGRTMVTRD